MKQPASIEVRGSESGCTLVELLSRGLNISKNKAKEHIDSRRVFVNGRRVWMARHRLKAGDEVQVGSGADTAGREARELLPRISLCDPALILYRDNDYLVINKPPGIKTEGTNSLESMLGSCSSALLPGGKTPFAVHRLDADTSGCVIFAGSGEAKARMIPLFAGRAIRKTYHGIVLGQLSETEFTIRRPVNGRTAVTRARILDSNKSASHVLIVIETGRTHQIRKHFSAMGHPVAGDHTYGARRRVAAIERTVPRQMLHAFKLEFEHPSSGLRIKCEAPLPRDFRQCLGRYGLT